MPCELLLYLGSFVVSLRERVIFGAMPTLSQDVFRRLFCGNERGNHPPLRAGDDGGGVCKGSLTASQPGMWSIQIQTCGNGDEHDLCDPAVALFCVLCVNCRALHSPHIWPLFLREFPRRDVIFYQRGKRASQVCALSRSRHCM